MSKNENQGEFQLTQVGQETAAFELMQRQARVFTQSSLVPVSYQGEKNIGNCIIAMDMAKRMRANPLMVMQNLYVVHGNPAWSSKFLIATINNCGRFSPLRYEFKGEEGKDDWACRCYAYEKSDTEKSEPLYGDWISISMAKKEGWASKAGSKWATMPGQMLRYRAAAFWQRVYAPEISMGLGTAEEAEDVAAAKSVVEVPAVEVVDAETGEVVTAETPKAADIIAKHKAKKGETVENPDLFNQSNE